MAGPLANSTFNPKFPYTPMKKNEERVRLKDVAKKAGLSVFRIKRGTSQGAGHPCPLQKFELFQKISLRSL